MAQMLSSVSRRLLVVVAILACLASQFTDLSIPVAHAATTATYSATQTIPVPPASTYAGSGGGDGWAVALSSTSVYNVFHHSYSLTVACHLQSDASSCWNPETITDSAGDGFATPGQPGLWLDQNSGKLYTFATRTSDNTGGVVCIDTSVAATNPDPFCGFTQLTSVGEAPVQGGISAISAPAQVNGRLYAFNYVNGCGVNGCGVTGDQNKLLCFDLSTLAACGSQPFGINVGASGTDFDNDYPEPAVAAIAGRVIVPVALNGSDVLACYDPSVPFGTCAGSWPIQLGFGYDSQYGAPFPILTRAGSQVGLCLPTDFDPCFDLTGATLATPSGMTSAIAGTSGWNGAGLTVGPRVYVPDGNQNAVDCYDYAANAGCTGFPKTLANLGLLYTVNPDPQRPACIWVNSDYGSGQIQNFDAYSGGACGQGPIRVLASSFVVATQLCWPASYTSLQVQSPTRNSYSTGTVAFEDGSGNPIPGMAVSPLDNTGTVDLSGLNFSTVSTLPQFLITLNGASSIPSAVTVSLTWTGTYDPSCVNPGTTVTQGGSNGTIPLIFVPGIGGSELWSTQAFKASVPHRYFDTHGDCTFSTQQVIWTDLSGNPRTNPDANGCVGAIRFGDSGAPVYPAIAPDGSLISAAQAYDNVIPFFTQQLSKLGYNNLKYCQYSAAGGSCKGANFYVFTYDWRYGAQTNVNALDALVQYAMSNTGASSVDIIAHSMGTQVVRSWLLSGVHRNVVHNVVLNGPPNLGTPLGSAAAMWGTPCLYPKSLGPYTYCFPQQSTLQPIYASIPGGMDQAVSPAYTSVYSSTASGAGNPIPYVDVRQGQPSSAKDYALLRQAERNAGVTSAALNSAETFHQSDLTWMNQVPGHISIIAGTGQCTDGQILIKNVSWPFGLHQHTEYDAIQIDGDNTVPRLSASLNDGALAGPVSVYYYGGTHSDLGNSSGALAAAYELLFGNTSGVSTSPLSQRCGIVSVHSPMELQLTDSAGNQLGSLDPNQPDVQAIPGGTFQRIADMKMAVLQTPGVYNVSLQGTGNGFATIKFRLTQPPTVQTEYIFDHVPTTPKTTGTLTVDTASGSISALRLDLNGDGSNIQTFQPTLLSGAAANDYTPPSLQFTSPQQGQAVVGTFPIGWTASDGVSGVSSSEAIIDQGAAQQVLNQPGTAQAQPGIHTLDIYAENNAGLQATQHRELAVDAFQWLAPLTSGGYSGQAGQPVPVKFVVTNRSGTFADDVSVTVTLLSSQGIPVVGPLTYGTTSNNVVIQNQQYQANLATSGLPTGQYTIQVQFNSAHLLGSVTLPVTLS